MKKNISILIFLSIIFSFIFNFFMFDNNFIAMGILFFCIIEIIFITIVLHYKYMQYENSILFMKVIAVLYAMVAIIICSPFVFILKYVSFSTILQNIIDYIIASMSTLYNIFICIIIVMIVLLYLLGNKLLANYINKNMEMKK